jgi:hypothetical protein
MELKFIAAITLITTLVPPLCQMNEIHVFMCYLLEIRFNNIVRLRLGFPSVVCSSVFRRYILYVFILCIFRVLLVQPNRPSYLNNIVISGQSCDKKPYNFSH